MSEKESKCSNATEYCLSRDVESLNEIDLLARIDHLEKKILKSTPFDNWSIGLGDFQTKDPSKSRSIDKLSG